MFFLLNSLFFFSLLQLHAPTQHQGLFHPTLPHQHQLSLLNRLKSLQETTMESSLRFLLLQLLHLPMLHLHLPHLLQLMCFHQEWCHLSYRNKLCLHFLHTLHTLPTITLTTLTQHTQDQPSTK